MFWSWFFVCILKGRKSTAFVCIFKHSFFWFGGKLVGRVSWWEVGWLRMLVLVVLAVSLFVKSQGFPIGCFLFGFHVSCIFTVVRFSVFFCLVFFFEDNSGPLLPSYPLNLACWRERDRDPAPQIPLQEGRLLQPQLATKRKHDLDDCWCVYHGFISEWWKICFFVM